ncbi:MAG TPA: arabinofuranosidase catalytic domain-containing protein [Polyangiaceae bacterium]|nr:arabinofuranosidase catalytic domain-containing protein [Polyangiaceae bacterium]
MRTSSLVVLSLWALAACGNGDVAPTGAAGHAATGGSQGGTGGSTGSAGQGGSSASGGGASGNGSAGAFSGAGGAASGAGASGASQAGAGGAAGALSSGGTSPQAGTAGTQPGGGKSNAGGAGGAMSGGAAGSGGKANGGMSGSGGAAGAAGNAGAGGAGSVTGPCDIYATGNTPCVAAHSTVRALYGAYTGNLYQVKRTSDKTTKDIPVLAAGGFADAAVQDAFCMGTTCTISIIYDQSPKANHLTSAPGGGAKPEADKEASATALKLTVGGHSVYGISIATGMGYRNNKTMGIATGDQPEGEYMVTSGKHYNDGCCFDYGNAETTNNDDGNGTMEAIYFGNCTFWGKGQGNGPWVMADLENGLFAGQSLSANNANTPLTSEYVTAVVKGKAGGFAIKGGNAQSGALKTMYDGGRPTTQGYNPMKKQGAIILGIGGDNSNGAIGSFFEGVMTSGYPSDEADDAVQANIVAAGYGK